MMAALKLVCPPKCGLRNKKLFKKELTFDIGLSTLDFRHSTFDFRLSTKLIIIKFK